MSEKTRARITRIQTNIQRCIDTADHGRDVLTSIIQDVGKLVVEALNEDHHSLQHELRDLVEVIDRLIPAAKLRNRPTPGVTTRRLKTESESAMRRMVACFSPQPGISLSEVRGCWPTQLLLLAALSHPAGAKTIASRLDQPLGAIRAAAERGAAMTTCLWTPATYLQRLLQALELVCWDGPPVRLQGRFLQRGTERVKLSSQESVFIKLLGQRFGEYVNYEKLKEVGVTNPAKIRSKVGKKLDGSVITITIVSARKQYMLMAPRILVAPQPQGATDMQSPGPQNSRQTSERSKTVPTKARRRSK